AEVHEDAGVGIGLAAQHHLEAVVVAVQIEALAVVARKPVGGGKGEFGFDLMHAAPLALGCGRRQKAAGAGRFERNREPSALAAHPTQCNRRATLSTAHLHAVPSPTSLAELYSEAPLPTRHGLLRALV